MFDFKDFTEEIRKFDYMKDVEVTEDAFETCLDNWQVFSEEDPEGYPDPLRSGRETFGAFVSWCAENWEIELGG